MHLLCIHKDIGMFRMKILKGCVTPNPVTHVNLLRNTISILIIKYIVLNVNQM